MENRKKWSWEEVVKVFETLIDKGSLLTSSRHFRQWLNRDQSLLANQMVREANGNIAYRTVDFDIGEEMTDEAFWSRIEETPYNDMIEENAAVAMMRMAEKLKLID